MRSRLVTRRVRRHHDGRLHVEDLRRRRHALSVVAGGERDHAAAALVLRDRRELIEGAAELERAGPLQHFRLQKDLGAGALIEHGKRQQRRPHRKGRDHLGGRLDIGGADGLDFGWLSGHAVICIADARRAGKTHYGDVRRRNADLPPPNSATLAFGTGIGTGLQGMIDEHPRGGLPGVGGGEFDASLRAKSAALPGSALRKSSSSTPTGAAPITSRGPVTGKAATGRPLASASSSTRPNVSVLLGKYENAGGRVDFGQFLAVPCAEEHRIRIFPLQRRARRPVADDELGAGQIEIEEGLEILFDRDAADAKKHRRRQAKIGAARMKQRGVDAARPQHDIAKAARAQFGRQRRRCRHHRLARPVERSAAPATPRLPGSATAPKHIRENGCESSW